MSEPGRLAHIEAIGLTNQSLIADVKLQLADVKLSILDVHKEFIELNGRVRTNTRRADMAIGGLAVLTFAIPLVVGVLIAFGV